jgi:hypothetical protein
LSQFRRRIIGFCHEKKLKLSFFPSFAEVGKKLGEMWHALTEEEKESYRQRARDIGEQKLREYNERMKALPQHARGKEYNLLPATARHFVDVMVRRYHSSDF